jgi:hypothetical protein
LTGEAGFDRGQVIKWTVYGLLVVNFGYYFVEELYIASHTLRDGGSFLDWTRELATTIDEIGWLGLLLLFEMETYALPDETLEKKRVAWTIHGLRLLCYMMLAHTVFARVSTVQDIEAVELAQEVSSLCEVADQDISFGYNYRYTVIERSNCRDLAQDGRFYFLDSSVVTDTEGYELERKHVWVDLNDAVVWLLVVWAIELAVWLQNRDIAGGRLMTVTFAATPATGCGPGTSPCGSRASGPSKKTSPNGARRSARSTWRLSVAPGADQ